MNSAQSHVVGQNSAQFDHRTESAAVLSSRAYMGTVSAHMPNLSVLMTFHMVLWILLWVQVMSLVLGLWLVSTEVPSYCSTSAASAAPPASLRVSP